MLTVYVNTSASDSPLGTSGVNWIAFDSGNDKLIMSAGSADVADGQPIPSQAELVSAGVVLTGSQIIVSEYFLADLSANLLRKLFNMGNQDTRYVMAFDFDSDTASEPVFEVYDDANLNTINGTILGGGTPTSSFIRAVTTTYASSGSGWATSGGTVRMAGSSSSHFLFLNDQNGPLAAPQTLYCNLAYVIPASQVTGFSANPVYVVKWLDN